MMQGAFAFAPPVSRSARREIANYAVRRCGRVNAHHETRESHTPAEEEARALSAARELALKLRRQREARPVERNLRPRAEPEPEGPLPASRSVRLQSARLRSARHRRHPRRTGAGDVVHPM